MKKLYSTSLAWHECCNMQLVSKLINVLAKIGEVLLYGNSKSNSMGLGCNGKRYG